VGQLDQTGLGGSRGRLLLLIGSSRQSYTGSEYHQRP
jgi:hypothetical protein